MLCSEEAEDKHKRREAQAAVARERAELHLELFGSPPSPPSRRRGRNPNRSARRFSRESAPSPPSHVPTATPTNSPVYYTEPVDSIPQADSADLNIILNPNPAAVTSATQITDPVLAAIEEAGIAGNLPELTFTPDTFVGVPELPWVSALIASKPNVPDVPDVPEGWVSVAAPELPELLEEDFPANFGLLDSAEDWLQLEEGELPGFDSY